MAGINLVDQLNKPRGRHGTEAEGYESASEGGGLFARLRASAGAGSSEGFSSEDSAYLLRFLLGIGLIFGGRYLVENYTHRIQAELQAQVNEHQQQIAAEANKLRGLQGIRAELDDYERQMGELRRKLELIQSVGRNRNLVVRAIDYAITEMPESLWLKSVEIAVGTEGRIDLNGYALTHQIISEYARRLEGGVFFPSWNLVETISEETASRPTLGGTITSGAGTTPSSQMIGAKRFSLNAKVLPL